MGFCKGHKECQWILKNGVLAFFVAFFIGLDHKPPKWFVSNSVISKFSGAMWVKGGCRFTEEFSDQWNMATWLDVSWRLKPRDWWTWFEISSFDDSWTSLSTTYLLQQWSQYIHRCETQSAMGHVTPRVLTSFKRRISRKIPKKNSSEV